MKILEITERFIFQSPARNLIIAIGIAMLFKVGIWFMPNLDMQQEIATNPFIDPFQEAGAQYIYWNWLGPFLAWLIGANKTWTFFLFYFAFSLAFTLLFVWVIFRRLPDRSARISLVLFAALPVSATAYFWVGMDSLTFFSCS